MVKCFITLGPDVVTQWQVYFTNYPEDKSSNPVWQQEEQLAKEQCLAKKMLNPIKLFFRFIVK